MMRKIRLLQVAATLALLILTRPAALRADPQEDFIRLNKQCWDQMNMGNYGEAERLALRLKQMAEGPLADLPEALAYALNTRGVLYQKQARYAEAEPLFKHALAIREKLQGAGHVDTADCLTNLANLYQDQGRYSQAEVFYKQVLAIRETAFGPEHANTAQCLNNLANLYQKQGRFVDAAVRGKRALAIMENVLGPEHPDTAHCLNNLANTYQKLGRCADAEPLYERAIAIFEDAFGEKSLQIAGSLNNLAVLYCDQGRFSDAESLHRRALQITEDSLGPEHVDTATSLRRLAMLYMDQARYGDAEPLLTRILAVRESLLGGEHADTALSLNDLAGLYRVRSQYATAEPLYARALAIMKKAYGLENANTAGILNNLANLYSDQGRYAEAEPLCKQALAIRRNVLGPEHFDTAASLNNLANLYSDQGRYAEALSLYSQAVAIRSKTLGPEHPATAQSLSNLANQYLLLGKHAESEPLLRRALAIVEKCPETNSLTRAETSSNLANLCLKLGRCGEAELLYERALGITEESLGAEHPRGATILNNLAILYGTLGRHADAEAVCSRAVAIMDKAGVTCDMHCKVYWTRAQVAWKTHHRQQAVGDLQRAMEIGERIRAQSFGGVIQQAQSFAQYGSVFETMVDWQTELGNLGEGLDAMERSRARGLLNQMATAGVDLLGGVDEKTATELRRREHEAQTRVASLKNQLDALARRTDRLDDQRRVEQETLQTQLRQAQHDFAAAYADIRNASPTYRLAVGTDRKPVPLAKLNPWVADQDTLLLEYLLGQDDGYVLIVPADGEPRLEKLVVNHQRAASLGIDAGPLTAKRLDGVLRNDDETGILQRLARPNGSDEMKQDTATLASLWEVLVPKDQRNAILAGMYQRLIVIPDGTLANLPFETLVVNSPEDEPQYLVDVGPSIQYAPSATILMNLAKRRSEAANEAGEPVLTVGDCRYGRPSQAGEETLLAELAPQARYGNLGGRLDPLPHSRAELLWVSQVYGSKGTKVAWLEGDRATEAAVRYNAPGRRVLHFACHGLVDQSCGNLFGALAFTPSPQPDDPANDGFLTLAEIYELNLKGCELAILSACDTNYGPYQRGEGVWALSRGFLAAGARRVVASNWLVDDEAAASLISYFCSIIAKAEAAGDKPDYAEALWKAKRWVRNNPDHPEWKNPYYWGTFVLIGPK